MRGCYGIPLTAQATSGDLLQDRSILAHDAPRLLHAGEARRRIGVPPESVAVALVRGQIREVDEGQCLRGAAGVARGQEVAHEVASAAPDGMGEGAGVGLEVAVLMVLDPVADAEGDHGAPLLDPTLRRPHPTMFQSPLKRLGVREVHSRPWAPPIPSRPWPS